MAALTDLAPTNWLLTKHPDVYLYGALLQAEPYLANDARLATWGTLFANAIADVNADEQRIVAGAAPAMRARAIA